MITQDTPWPVVFREWNVGVEKTYTEIYTYKGVQYNKTVAHLSLHGPVVYRYLDRTGPTPPASDTGTAHQEWDAQQAFYMLVK